VVELALDPEAAGAELEVVAAVRLPGPAREAHLAIRRPRRRRRWPLHLLAGDFIAAGDGDADGDRGGNVVPARGLREPAPAGDGDAQPGELLLDRVGVGVRGADGGGGDRGDRGRRGVGRLGVSVGVRHWSRGEREETERERGGRGDGDGDWDEREREQVGKQSEVGKNPRERKRTRGRERDGRGSERVGGGVKRIKISPAALQFTAPSISENTLHRSYICILRGT
jgi:hypothetical protein